MRKWMPIIVALLVAAFATLGIVKWAQQVGGETKSIQCVVAKRDIQAGIPLTREDLGIIPMKLPSKMDNLNINVYSFLIDKQLVTADKMLSLVDRKLVRELRAGSPILFPMLEPITPRDILPDWRKKIPIGKRGISIPVNPTQSLSGLIKVSDHVDILANIKVPRKDTDKGDTSKIALPLGEGGKTVEIPYLTEGEKEPMTIYLLQDVEIIAVGSQSYNPDELKSEELFSRLGVVSRGGIGQNVTIALSPEQVQLIVFAICNGASEFTLVLRSPGDDKLIDRDMVPPITYDSLLNILGIAGNTNVNFSSSFKEE